jgi:hypothetical protein
VCLIGDNPSPNGLELLRLARRGERAVHVDEVELLVATACNEQRERAAQGVGGGWERSRNVHKVAMCDVRSEMWRHEHSDAGACLVHAIATVTAATAAAAAAASHVASDLSELVCIGRRLLQASEVIVKQKARERGGLKR